MTGKIEQRLKDLGIVLPDVTAPTANYVPAREHQGVMWLSGQVPRLNGVNRYVGKVGDAVSGDDAYQAARLCALNMVAQLRLALNGDLDRVASCLRLRGYVNAIDSFNDHPAVINGASGVIVEIFGESGRHSRTAVGVASLPRGFSVEVDGDFAIV